MSRYYTPGWTFQVYGALIPPTTGLVASFNAGKQTEHRQRKAPLTEYQGHRDTEQRPTGPPERAAGTAIGIRHQFRSTLDPFLQQERRLKAMQQMVREWGEELIVQRMQIAGILTACLR